MEWPSKKVARLSLLVAIAMVFSYIEFLIPIPLGLPGIKLGLANVVMVLALYSLGPTAALTVNLIRIFLTSLLFGNLSLGLYSLAGALLSWALMCLLKKSGRFTLAGVSMAGGAAHNIGQVAIAAALAGTGTIIFYLTALIPVGLITGLLIGLLTRRVLAALTPAIAP